jgi:hypothetical protein
VLKRSDGKVSKTLVFNLVSAFLLLLNEIGPLVGMLPDSWQDSVRGVVGFSLALGNIVLRVMTTLPIGAQTPATEDQKEDETPGPPGPSTTSSP